jgi:hypothetical protein
MHWFGLLSSLLLLSGSSSAFKADDFLVEGLEEIYPQFSHFKGDMHAGMLPIDIDVAPEDKRGELMFWLFQPHKPVAPDTLTIWFNGGPVRNETKYKRTWLTKVSFES